MLSFYLIIAAAIIAVFVMAYFFNETARNWMRSIWERWFKDSEVNFFADIIMVIGMLAEGLELMAADPEFAAVLTDKVGVAPGTLVLIGLAFRVFRMLRDRSMVPLTKTED